MMSSSLRPLLAIALFLGLVCMTLAASRSKSRVGVHSMLYTNTPFGGKKAMFKEAAAAGASYIRLDIALSGVFADPNKPDWSGVKEYMSLARKYKLKVLAVILTTPWYLAACPAGIPADRSYICPPNDPKKWAQLAGRVAKYTRGVINDFEIINEADGAWAFAGTPQQYAAILSHSYAAIHKANKKARVSMAGLMRLSTKSWVNAVFAAKGFKAAKKFDIANIHVRAKTYKSGPIVKAWKKFFQTKCKRCPLWVTETGYAADPKHQHEEGLKNGPKSQAKWFLAAGKAMLKAGAQMIFATERDQGVDISFATEGFLQSADPLTNAPVYKRRPMFAAVKKLAKSYFLKGKR